MITSSLLHMSPGAPWGSKNILQVSRDSCLCTIQENNNTCPKQKGFLLLTILNIILS